MQKLLNRKTKVASYYFDLTLVGDYWGALASLFSNTGLSHPSHKARVC